MKYLRYSIFLVVSLSMLIFCGDAFAEGKFKVGDKIHLKGTYTASSDGSGKQYGGLYSEYIISRIQPNAKNPYALQPIGKSWVDGWANESSILHDYTDEIFRGFISELQHDSYFLYFGEDAQPIYALTSYFEKFNHGAKYDIKWKGIWEKMFSAPFPGTGVKFWFYKYEMSADELGNYLYAAAGSYWGFSRKVIHQGAGFAEQRSTKYLNRPDLYYGDKKEDYDWIEIGINDFSSNVKYDLDLSELARNSSLWDYLIETMQNLM